MSKANIRSTRCALTAWRRLLTKTALAANIDRPTGDRLPHASWRAMVTSEVRPVYLEIDLASKLEGDLRRIGEKGLAERTTGAIETAKR